MDAERLAMNDALVQQQNQNFLRLQKVTKNLSELLSKRSVQLRSQKRYAAKPTLSPRRVNARMLRTPLYQRSRHRLINARLHSLSLSESNAGFSGAPLRQRPCFPHFVRGGERFRNLVPSPYRSRNAPTKFVR